MIAKQTCSTGHLKLVLGQCQNKKKYCNSRTSYNNLTQSQSGAGEQDKGSKKKDQNILCVLNNDHNCLEYSIKYNSCILSRYKRAERSFERKNAESSLNCCKGLWDSKYLSQFRDNAVTASCIHFPLKWHDSNIKYST